MKKLQITIILLLPLWGLGGFALAQTATIAQNLTVPGNINTTGKIQINGNSGTTGQVLTSNGNAAPSWQNIVTSTGGKFFITPTNNTRTTNSFTGRGGWIVDGATNPTSQEDSLDYGNISHEIGTDFTISNPGLKNNFITVARTGTYHFEGALRYFATSAISVIMLPRATLYFKASQTTFPDLNLLLLEDPMDKTGGSEVSSSTNQYNYTGKFQFNIHLEAGTKFTFITGFNLLRFPGAADLIGLGVSSGGYISGQFISE